MKTSRVLLLVLALLAVLHVQNAQAFYNPSTGRWLSRDPIGERGGFNTYCFILNQPVLKIDILGRTVYPHPPNPDEPTRPPSPPDIIFDPNDSGEPFKVFICPTALQNVIPFRFSITGCARRCVGFEMNAFGAVGDCYGTNGDFLTRVVTGLHHSYSIRKSLLCCCRNGRLTVRGKFADQEFEGSDQIDINAWLRRMGVKP